MSNAILVPNSFPKIPPGEKRLACVGEAPGTDETTVGAPFVGTSGRLLRAVLGGCGIACDQVFFGNVCQQQPPGNNIDAFDFNGPEITFGLERLRVDLSEFRPNCVLLLGKTAFRAFRPDLCYQTRKGFVVPLGDWRGSVFETSNFLPVLGEGSTGPASIKCVAAYHPAFILRSYGDMPYFKFDVARAVRHSSTPDLRLAVRGGNLRPTLNEVRTFLQKLHLERRPVTLDIEGFADDVGITMLSLCTDPVSGVVIPFWCDGKNYWSLEEEIQVWQILSTLLADPSIPKTAHNAFYELFVLAWRHRCVVNNLADDTMMKHWEVFPEFERSLAVCCSIYTDQPYYKSGRLSENADVKLRYNLTDSQVTHEVNGETEKKLCSVQLSRDHYRFNVNLIPAYNYIMLRGCRFDVEKGKELARQVSSEIISLNAEISSSLGRDFNVKSIVDKRWLLYDHLGYKPLKRYGDSTAEDVLLHFWTKEQHPTVRLVIRCIRKRTRLSDINKLLPSSDGRLRTSYDVVGTNTGRLSSRSSIAMELIDGEWTNVGTNLQNVTKDLRVCFIPDTCDRSFWQFDLSGADGWTVAADLAALGHGAMLDDYLSGVKPALVLYYMLQEHAAGRDPSHVNRLDRATLKSELRRVKQEIDSLEGKSDSQGRPLDWQYLCCKRVQHGSNYGAHPEKIAEVIFGDSDGTVVLSRQEATLYQSFYKLRYNTDARNDRIRRRLSDEGALVAACGIRRQFFGIRNRRDIDDATVREAAAFEPQANTTWATNKALERLWYDVRNRNSRGGLFVEPLLQIHDALAGQYKSRDSAWAHEKLREWFQNPLRVAGTMVTIPADGKFGPNWKECVTPITS